MTFKTASARIQYGLTCLIAATAMLISASPAVQAKNRHVEEVIAGGIVGLAVGAALSRQHQHNKQIYYRDYTPRYPVGGYDPYFAQSFSPAAGVICYTAQRACYRDNGHLSNKWSRREFGY